MADKPKGNLFLELFIVVLLAALLITILYPKKVWEGEAEVEIICQARMEAIESLEYQFMAVNNTYTDEVDSLLDIDDNVSAIAAVDSTVNWDKLINAETLEALIQSKSLPEDLRSLIRGKLTSHQGLGNLMRWDSLEYKLMDALEEEIARLPEATSKFDSSIAWQELVGETQFWKIFEDGVQMPQSQKNQARRAIRSGKIVIETSVWPSMKDTLRTLLKEAIVTAETADVWAREQKDRWEARTRAVWEADMDALTRAKKDSIWKAHEADFWTKEKVQLWANERKDLWGLEGQAWKEANKDVWERKYEQQWRLERKKSWIEAFKKGKPDSVATLAESKWREGIDSLQNVEFDSWMKKNQKQVNDDIQGIWERERKPVWEENRYPKWLESKRTDLGAYWDEIKEGLWISTVRQSEWEAEEKKLARKKSALNALNNAVDWYAILGAQTIEIVDALELPDSNMLLKHVRSFDSNKGSALYYYGIADLFRNSLLDHIKQCPVARLPYVIEVQDTAAIKQFSVACPIIEQDIEKLVFGLRAPFVMYTKRGKFVRLGVRFPFVKKVGSTQAYVKEIDAETGEAMKTPLKPNAIEKLFGGRKIGHHGSRDKEGKKSWATKGGG